MAIENFLTACIREGSHQNFAVAMSCVCNVFPLTPCPVPYYSGLNEDIGSKLGKMDELII